MTFPPDGAMLTLLAMWTGEGLEASDGELFLTLPDGNRAAVPPSVLDTLEELGYVTIDEHGAQTTERAGYILNKWITAKARQRGQHGCFELKSARVSRAGRVA